MRDLKLNKKYSEMNAQERFFYFGVSDERKQNQIAAAMNRLENEGVSFALKSAYQEAQRREENYRAIMEKEGEPKETKKKEPKNEDEIDEEELEEILSAEAD